MTNFDEISCWLFLGCYRPRQVAHYIPAGQILSVLLLSQSILMLELWRRGKVMVRLVLVIITLVVKIRFSCRKSASLSGVSDLKMTVSAGVPLLTDWVSLVYTLYIVNNAYSELHHILHINLKCKTISFKDKDSAATEKGQLIQEQINILL